MSIISTSVFNGIMASAVTAPAVNAIVVRSTGGAAADGVVMQEHLNLFVPREEGSVFMKTDGAVLDKAENAEAKTEFHRAVEKKMIMLENGENSKYVLYFTFQADSSLVEKIEVRHGDGFVITLKFSDVEKERKCFVDYGGEKRSPVGGDALSDFMGLTPTKFTLLAKKGDEGDVIRIKIEEGSVSLIFEWNATDKVATVSKATVTESTN